METIRISATEDTPEVVLDPVSKVFEISGRSLPEDVVVFYQPVIKWFDQLEQTPVSDMTLSIKLEYFNTASSKLILDILLKLEDIHRNDNSIRVKWYYPVNDSDMREAGEEYSEIVEIPIELTEY